MGRHLVIYGAGGFAREVAWLAEQCDGVGRVRAFVDDQVASHGKLLNGIPVIGFDQACREYPDAGFVLAVGSPGVRARLAERVRDAGLPFVSLIHPRVERSLHVDIGEGAVICAGSILTTNITLGRQVQINLACTIGHDVIMDDYVTLAPGVHVSGWVHLRAGAYVGTGASIINGTADKPLIIGEGAVIGAGACVTRDVPAHATAVGVPARPLPARS